MQAGTLTLATLPDRLSTFWDQCSFSIGDVDFLWIDVQLAAMAHGEWAGFERRLSEGLACAARADAEGLCPPEPAVEEAATAFRYERDLISGSEMTAWLDAGGLTTDEWMAYVTRDRPPADVGPLTSKMCSIVSRLRRGSSTRAAVGEGICSGVFDAFARSFSERAALAIEEDGSVLSQDRLVRLAARR